VFSPLVTSPWQFGPRVFRFVYGISFVCLCVVPPPFPSRGCRWAFENMVFLVPPFYCRILSSPPLCPSCSWWSMDLPGFVLFSSFPLLCRLTTSGATVAKRTKDPYSQRTLPFPKAFMQKSSIPGSKISPSECFSWLIGQSFLSALKFLSTDPLGTFLLPPSTTLGQLRF